MEVMGVPDGKKAAGALRFGILGASDIGPRSIIEPANSHPDVILWAVAARNIEKAKAYAQKHGIAKVRTSYQDIVEDPEIDCIYIPAPNGLHYEWALRAIKAGKHVLLEKPSASNALEAERLFTHPVLCGPNAPVLLEAAHSFFHPTWSTFMTYVNPKDVDRAKSTFWVTHSRFDNNDIRYNYDLAGGALMDLGAYTAAALSRVFRELPIKCEHCTTEPGPDPRCDRSYQTKYQFPNGGYGEMEGDFAAPRDGYLSELYVWHRPVIVDAETAGLDKTPEVHEITRTRQIKFTSFHQPGYGHSIEIDDIFVQKEKGGTVQKEWKATKTVEANTWHDAGVDQPSDKSWTTYRYQLEQFVDKVRGKKPRQWIGPEESIITMKMIDMAYEAAGLPIRPTSDYQ